MSSRSTGRTKPTPKQRAATTHAVVTAEQAFLRDAVRDAYWAQRGVLGRFVRRAATA